MFEFRFNISVTVEETNYLALSRILQLPQPPYNFSENLQQNYSIVS
jgi:hypothetical protein